MTERGILFSGAMVRALLDGTKTQTRRAVKPQPERCEHGGFVTTDRKGKRWAHGLGFNEAATRKNFVNMCPYGQPGDRLWVRESYRFTDVFDGDSPARVGERCIDAGYNKPWAPIQYDADGARRDWKHTGTPPHAADPQPGKGRASIHMPRWASRILLEITSVRVERLQEICEADAIEEGIEPNWCGDLTKGPNGFGGEGWTPDCGWRHYLNSIDGEPAYTAVDSYRTLWESINGAGNWDANPWVWAVEFRRIG